MKYEDYISKWDNELLDEGEYKRIDKYNFARLKMARHSLESFLAKHNEGLDSVQQESLNQVQAHMNKIHQNSTGLESEFNN